MTCRHPAINTPDDTQRARVGDQYAAGQPVRLLRRHHVADEVVLDLVETQRTAPARRAPTTTDDVRMAFGEKRVPGSAHGARS